jgi:CheY-like chemotaxis protein
MKAVPPRSRILVIDDSTSVLQFMAQTLTTAGHSVATAADGMRGLEQMRGERFDLVITDLYMPELDGIETLRRARQEKLVTHAIAISSKDSIINLLPVARLLGARVTLQKPFTEVQLLEAVAAVLA